MSGPGAPIARLIGATPVGWPGLIVIALGGVLFFATLVAMRMRVRGGGGSRSRLSAIGIAVQMIGIAAAGMGPIRATLAPTAPASIAGAVLVAVLIGGSVLLFRSATAEMGRNWSLVARTRDDHELVTSGVFARVRNPIYCAMGLFLLALALSFGHLRSLAVALPLFALGTALRVAEEERLLRARFGSAYEAYAARVKRFVPGLF
jgi:protein-S-isoprenylcysteine O-methyltransferase Ste14